MSVIIILIYCRTNVELCINILHSSITKSIAPENKKDICFNNKFSFSNTCCRCLFHFSILMILMPS